MLSFSTTQAAPRGGRKARSPCVKRDAVCACHVIITCVHVIKQKRKITQKHTNIYKLYVY